MKNLFLIFALVFSTISVSSANNNPENTNTIIETADYAVTFGNSDLISLASFNVNESSFDFETNEEIGFIQIFDTEGNLEFQLPVSSSKVRINKDLFESGQSKLGFLLKESGEIQFAEVSIK